MKKTYSLIVIYIIILIFWHILFFKNTVNLDIKFLSPFSLNYYFSFLSIIFWSFFWIYKWLDLRDLQEEKEKHLWYIRTINDRVWKKIDWNFFTDIEKAKKFCEKEEYYIVPYWYKFNISSIDNEEIVDTINEKSEYDLLKDKVKNNFSIDILYTELKDVKEFINLEYFIERLDSKKINNFDIQSQKLVSETFFELNSINENKNELLAQIESQNDFIIIEWYYYIYKL